MQTCSQNECKEVGTWRPVLLLRASSKSPPVYARLVELKSCARHKEESGLDTFLSDEGWVMMARKLREAGKGRFAKSLTTLDWEEVPEVLPF